VRDQLFDELVELLAKRKDLRAQLTAGGKVGEELKEVDAEVEAKRRMLELVDTTEQQLAVQGAGQHARGPDPGRTWVEPGTQVRFGASAGSVTPS
jgi:hypothetical protein